MDNICESNRKEFIEHLTEVNACLMVLTQDIKYPLEKEREEYLNGAAALIGYLCKVEMEDDLKKTLAEMGRKQKEVQE